MDSNSNFLAEKQQIFDRWAPSYDFLFLSVFYQAIHKRLLDYVQFPDQPQVLDIGCGTGKLLNRLAHQFPNLQGTGLDLSPEMLRQAERQNLHRSRLTYREGSSTDMPLGDNHFEAAFSTISFLHYPDPVKVLREVCRILKPAGRFYLVDYIPQWTTEDIQKIPLSVGGLRFYSQRARTKMGKQANLDCVGHYHLLGPVMLTILVKPN